MTLSRRVTWVAIALIALSLFNIVTLSVTRDTGTQELLVRAVRFGLTCALAYQLAKGRSWARWLTAILTGLAALVLLATLFTLNASGALLRSSVIMGAIYTALSLYLIFSKRVAAECAPAQ